MFDPRDAIENWARAGALPRDRVAEALRIASVTPSPAQWRTFVERLLVWLGAILIAAAAAYFVAANWQALGRVAKFGLVELGIAAAVGIVCWHGLDTLPGRAALFVAALMTGVLLALVGQAYQTGADTFELFAAWALFILPWVIVSRQPALWLLWIALVDVAIVFYFRTDVARGIGVLDLVFTSRAAIWWVLAFDAAALLAWEAASAMRGGWLAVRWAPRIVAAAIGVGVTLLAVDHLVGISKGSGIEALVALAAFAAAMYWAYRVRTRDLFMLAGLVLSGIVVIAVASARYLLHGGIGEASLLTGIVVIACTAAGSVWLREVAAEARADP